MHTKQRGAYNDDLFVAALASHDPKGELFGVVQALLADGKTLDGLTKQLMPFYLTAQDTDDDDTMEVVGVFLESLGGWCGPHMTLSKGREGSPNCSSR